MAKFVVEMVYGDDEERRLAVRPDHRVYAKSLAEQGVLLAGGPYADGLGAQLVYEAEDEAAVQRLLDADPYLQQGVLASTTIREWHAITGSWVS
ncbi:MULTISPECIES: YciI family protein [Saccharopolyspora]|uniref:YCII-related domain-containing protein n=1 Tax=Saccharopolyspora gregorii TaxID=33914 RepID=A0ABP6S0G8_9PSEU|nr:MULTISPECIES: YciI family protein [unclassified Saccharopolyspora]MCA1189515.1 YciI family protein [Saccharopolyspora sp. 6T]MCA1195975.1 YciI family protein [Saccharopolyspora sp. 6V]MCA1228873.1 YciI family protein [Saccharopolyspora sp. 6M]MCA1282615.1 YciI family protein [Saccharopolyspora sp. 7B]